mmetsp:Transcript_77261/g.196216  ORF Transcript_77261/g.196216 Transcript_77261/m.196216 type:complete len:267 (+) Transcript_77261:99-899(+)
MRFASSSATGAIYASSRTKPCVGGIPSTSTPSTSEPKSITSSNPSRSKDRSLSACASGPHPSPRVYSPSTEGRTRASSKGFNSSKPAFGVTAGLRRASSLFNSRNTLVMWCACDNNVECTTCLCTSAAPPPPTIKEATRACTDEGSAKIAKAASSAIWLKRGRQVTQARALCLKLPENSKNGIASTTIATLGSSFGSREPPSAAPEVSRRKACATIQAPSEWPNTTSLPLCRRANSSSTPEMASACSSRETPVPSLFTAASVLKQG